MFAGPQGRALGAVKWSRSPSPRSRQAVQNGMVDGNGIQGWKITTSGIERILYFLKAHKGSIVFSDGIEIEGICPFAFTSWPAGNVLV
jgi:hypothetical protein